MLTVHLVRVYTLARIRTEFGVELGLEFHTIPTARVTGTYVQVWR